MTEMNERQQQILALVAEGLSDQSIADRLGLSIHTVKWHNRQIYQIAEVDGRTQAVAWARKRLWVTSQDGRVRHNLPAASTAFLGREPLVAEVARAAETVRLTTLFGPPGIGKTRLALEAAGRLVTRFAEGVWFVFLGPCATLDQALRQVAEVLGISFENYTPIQTVLNRRLVRGQRLVILDNAEHLPDLAEPVAEWTVRCPDLRVLVTSRKLLQVYGEKALAVTPLSLDESVALFLDRTTGFEGTPLVKKICGRLEGIPLAIELAAVRTKVLSPEVLLKRLDSRLRLLSATLVRGVARPLSLRAAIEASYLLLSPSEQRLFGQLAVFSGGWSLEAAEALSDAPHAVLDLLESLLNQSLIYRREGRGAPRFHMYETLREFAFECLDAHEQAEARRRHARYFSRWAQTWGGLLRGARCVEAIGHLQQDHSNVVLALEWTSQEDPLLFWMALTSIGHYWYFTARFYEGRAWLVRARSTAAGAPVGLRSLLAMGLAGVLYFSPLPQDAQTGLQAADESLDLALRDGTDRLVAWARAVRAVQGTRVESDFGPSLVLAQQAIEDAKRIGDEGCLAMSELVAGNLLHLLGREAEAEAAYLRAIGVATRSSDVRIEAMTLGNLGILRRQQNRSEDADLLFVRALRLLPDYLFDQHMVATILCHFAGTLVGRKRFAEGLRIMAAGSVAIRSLTSAMRPLGNLYLTEDCNLAVDHFGMARAEVLWDEGAELSLGEALSEALALAAQEF